ncbi:MAG: nucleotidyl transferase AbiEii/AbiGii toxin family protein [Dehalococcoidales bacterium]|nr:nucleotidyl transferase AbiEii/AbiGii toxin family protein [Dehalococcoidales bacterium]
MTHIFEQMISKHEAVSLTDKKNVVKEVVQEFALHGMYKAGLFNTAAFYGGTALRIFHGLDRFSEDLDFSLRDPDPAFQLDRFLPVLEKDLNAYGLHVNAESRTKVVVSDIQTAFLKGNMQELVLSFYTDDQESKQINGSELIKIKIELDTTPPPYAGFEHKYRLWPEPFGVQLYDQPSLFAGKLHAVICRAWKNRTKGRDLYDYVFYLSHRIPVNLKHLNARLMDSGFAGAKEDMTLKEIKEILYRRFETIDYDIAKQDVEQFISNKGVLDIWSADFFQSITDDLLQA